MKKFLLFVALVFSAAGTYAQTTCANAVNLTTNGVTVVPTITGTYPGALCWATPAAAPKAMWYKYTPTTGGVITVSSDIDANPIGETGTDTRLGILTGTCGQLTCVAGNDDVDASGDPVNYRSKVVDFVVTAGTTYYFCWDNRWSAAGFSFQFTFTAQSCFKPTGFTFLELPTETTATIGWTAPTAGAPTGYQVEYGPEGFTQGTGTILNVTEAQVAFTGLNPSTVYGFYVRTFCGGTDYSLWAGPITFATVFTPVTPEYTTSFEAANLDFIGWVAPTAATGGDWFINAASVGSALVQDGASSLASVAATDGDSDGIVFSRGVNLSAGMTYTISYYVSNFLASADDFGTSSYVLGVGTAADEASITANLLTEAGIADAAFTLKSVNFTPSTTGTYFFSFLNNTPINEGVDTQALLIDSFKVSAPLSVADVLSGKFSILPNPATSLITISNTENINITSVSVTDLNGRTVKRVNVNGVNANVNVSDLATGMYMVNVNTDRGTVVKKIMKN